MGFASIDAVVAALTAGQQWKAFWQKLTVNAATSAANRWHELFTGTGIPTALGAFSGGAGAIVVPTDVTTGAPAHGGDVTPSTKHLANVLAVTPTATVVPGFAMLVDLLAVYPSLVVTGAPTALTNGSAITRYTTGAGNYAFMAVQTALGAAAPNISITYRDADDGGDHASGQLVSPVNSAPVSTLFGNTTVSTGPFFALASGTGGVRNIQSYTINSGGTTGTAWLGICHPLATIPLLAANTAVERDCLFQLPSMPQIHDGACLGWLLLAGAAMITGANLMFTADVVWGA